MSVVASLILLLAGTLTSLILLVRVQLLLLAHYPTAEWPAMAAGLLAGGVTLAIAVAMALRLRSPRRALMLLLALPTMLLTAGCLSVTHFPRSNFKSDELRAEWYRLHPTLRNALWVARLGEGALILTDVTRKPSNYGEMGLTEPSWSSHFTSPRNGYAHAIDLRVRDAGDLRNWARQGVFLALGLKADRHGGPTDRHGGTADHLHVSLPLRQDAITTQ
ncbi:MAG TPA: hypothetical protein QGF95_03300 [Candidatus Latescibacteria bacterium]|jgi:hypothetical protein|nr:hypothetical protein [Gemmatimonadaceae bacterium]HJP29563.1 hypothetical protein [Candidatus Latescibacterota bacterium]